MSIVKWLENSMLSCPYQKYFNIDCMGCGIQRSIIALLKGNFAESFYYYPALFPMSFLFLFSIIHVIFKLKHGTSIIKYQFIFVVAIVLINFIIKLMYK